MDHFKPSPFCSEHCDRGKSDFFSWTQDLVSQYDKMGVLELAREFDLTENQQCFVEASLNNFSLNPVIIARVLAIIGLNLTEGMVSALLYNLAMSCQKIDVDELLVDAVALERYLMYNNCRENSRNSCVQRASQTTTSRILKHVIQHSKTLNTTRNIQQRYFETLVKIPTLLQQYVNAVKVGKTMKNVREGCECDRPKSPFLLAPIFPGDYPPVGERNQDTFELREKRRKKLRLKWTQIASPCQLKNQHLRTMAHSNNLHVWSLNERRKDLVQLPHLTLKELSKHPDNLTIEDVTELREKVNFRKQNYYRSYLNATEMGTEEHWTELLGHEITSPTLKQVTRASFMTYSNPRYKLTFSPWEPKPFWMLRSNPTATQGTHQASATKGEDRTMTPWR